MDIELSNEKYWKEMKYYDGLLYCQLLEIDGKNDWRIPTDDEISISVQHGMIPNNRHFCHLSTANIQGVAEWVAWIIPVRDV